MNYPFVSQRALSFSFTPRFSGVVGAVHLWRNRFNGFNTAPETAEAVFVTLRSWRTPLKRGVNERI
jgi:hypothetical protein